MHTATAVPSLSKIEARVRALADRRAFARDLSPEHRTALERQLCDRVLPHLGTASTVAVYYPMIDEIDPLPIARALEDAGRIVALPWFASRDAMMTFRQTPARVAGPWGVLQPVDDADAVAPEIVLVPLVAADPACNRIGHGKGHYDRALRDLREAGPVRTIGLAWDMQILGCRIAADPWDVPLDAIATPDRWMKR